MTTDDTFTVPPAWAAFLADVERRTGQTAGRIGYWALCANHMDRDEQDRAEAILRGLLAIAEASPVLDVQLHGWLRLKIADTREGRWHRCRREGCLPDLLRRREAQREADRWTRIARDAA